MIRPLLIILIVFTIFSCKKDESDDGIKPEDKQKAEALTAFLQSDQFRLKKYYSETPIDYIDTDQVVKSESDLWQYVSSWLHDDAYVFNTNGTVTIQQGPLKFIPIRLKQLPGIIRLSPIETACTSILWVMNTRTSDTGSFYSMIPC